MFKYLFSPIVINQLEIKNRIAYPALGLLFSYDSKLNDRYDAYFRERARGGAGLVTVGPVGIDDIGAGLAALSLATDDAIPDFQKLTKIIKAEGARAWIQLFHAGAYAFPFLINNQTPIAPSAVYSNYSKTTPREMTLEDIERVQTAFAQAAGRAVEAGFDGIEIIGSAGYLICQFLSPKTNLRTDAYGGSFENRLRFPTETIACTRTQIGPDVPLTIRMAGNDFMPGSNTDAETPAIAKAYEAAGVDALNVTGGWHETRVPQLPMELPRAALTYLALNVKKAVNVPVMASNRISDPYTGEKILRDGGADMINLGRPLIADPEWPNKAKAGRPEEIRPCTGCSQGCTDQIFNGLPVFCVGNPQAGFENERQLIPAQDPKRIMVVGAGLAGLEAAVTAAQIGHQVKVYDKSPDIGGQIWIAGAPPHKQELLELLRYYRAMLRKYDIPVFLNSPVDAAFIRENAPDHVIVAEGAKALLPPINGADDPSALSSWDVLGDNPPLGQEVAVIGGGSVGLETALFVAAKGTLTPEMLHFLFEYEAESPERLKELMFAGTSQVTIFEMLPKPGKDHGKSTKWVLLGKLKRYGVDIITDATVQSIKNGVVSYEKDGEIRSRNFDSVILAAGSQAVQDLTRAVAPLNIPYTAVGDCTQPGKIDDAVHGGFLAAIGI
ncbi:MAG TPA: FAD-dependent oxidoreductase [Desulfosalsimonadaceae bacterium]|nr:FAD-dependent oxidoreductase [Desulfosalsimonadaceae bacterium]